MQPFDDHSRSDHREDEAHHTRNRSQCARTNESNEPISEPKKYVGDDAKNSERPIVIAISLRPPPVEKFMAVAIVPGPARMGIASGDTATPSAASRLLFLSPSLG